MCHYWYVAHCWSLIWWRRYKSPKNINHLIRHCSTLHWPTFLHSLFKVFSLHFMDENFIICFQWKYQSSVVKNVECSYHDICTLNTKFCRLPWNHINFRISQLMPTCISYSIPSMFKKHCASSLFHILFLTMEGTFSISTSNISKNI